jgi:hypothetical protein
MGTYFCADPKFQTYLGSLRRVFWTVTSLRSFFHTFSIKNSDHGIEANP